MMVTVGLLNSSVRFTLLKSILFGGVKKLLAKDDI